MVRGKIVAAMAGAAAVAVAVGFLMSLGPPDWARQRVRFPVTLRAGKLQGSELIRLLADGTGMVVLLGPEDEKRIRQLEINLPSDIVVADEEILKAILEVNRLRVFREQLPSGREVIKVETIQVAPRRVRRSPPPALLEGPEPR